MRTDPTERAARATKTVDIDVPPDALWRALTEPRQVATWMSDDEFALDTAWRVGGPIAFRGRLHGKIPFENTGTVLAFEPPRRLRYTHYSSLSRRAFADVPEHRVTLDFALAPSPTGTTLTLALENLFDDAVRGHLDFYWEMTLTVLKRWCETGTTAAPHP
ncbi:MAG TPA: SRPBCC domain-containing protein [Tahibacter sp.]|nr:SRPBCC domain-containing protein [Tahibacter sp.]